MSKYGAQTCSVIEKMNEYSWFVFKRSVPYTVHLNMVIRNSARARKITKLKKKLQISELFMYLLTVSEDVLFKTYKALIFFRTKKYIRSTCIPCSFADLSLYCRYSCWYSSNLSLLLHIVLLYSELIM